MPKKRVLWLFNHCTLIKSEVPILKELGYEVFIPKIPPFDVSIAVDWSEDKNLSIPKDELDVLNRTDFYDSKIPRAAMEIMNEYFDAVIFGVFIESFKSLVTSFKGKLIFHPFGVSNETSYTNIIRTLGGNWLLKRIEGLGNRFWFGQSYKNLSEIECEFFQRRAIYLPIGMKDTNIIDRWSGTRKKVLFICPRIKINSYYNGIYQKFKTDFEGVPYSIGGVQPIAVNDDNSVVGYLPDEEYADFYPSHSCMFYHSQEKRHIHYHPFEAIKCGLPLIFMAGGMLDLLGGKKLPGRCKTIKEARMKCNKIINGDLKLANKIRKSQEVLLDTMSYEKCRNLWIKGINEIENTEINVVKDQNSKLAVILPEAYRGGLLDYTINLLKILRNGSDEQKDMLDIVFGFPEELLDDNRELFESIEEINVSLRTFEWETVGADRIKNYSKLIGNDLSYFENEYSIMNDGIRYFEDCDYMLFVVDRVRKNLFITKPYGVIVHDYIQRYVPELMGSYYEKPNIDLIRNSEANFTTTMCTLEDCVQYAGAKRENMHLIPLFFGDIEVNNVYTNKNNKSFFLWSTNISFHKNHIMMLKAMELYYSMGGNLDCHITGVFTELFDPKVDISNYELLDIQIAYLEKCRSIIFKNKTLRRHLLFEGNLAKDEYYTLLASAKFLIHPGYGDNGNGSAIDAGLLGVPTLSSNYPAMRNMEDKMHLGITFFERNKPEALSKLLIQVEKNLSDLKNRVPCINELKKHTVSNPDLCKSIYTVFRNNIDI